MKELMVTLILLTWTGMVVAQDNNDNAFRTSSGADGRSFGSSGAPQMVPIVSAEESGRGGSDFGQATDRRSTRAQSGFSTQGRPAQQGSSTRSMLDSRQTVRDSFPARATERTNPLARTTSTGTVDQTQAPTQPIAYLGLPADAINALRESGSVKAPVDGRFIDQIKISDRNVPKVAPIRNIRPELRGDTLVFQFDAQQLSEINEYSYVFDVPPSLKGQYKSATIEYPPALARREASRTQPSTTGNSSFQSEDSRWRLAGTADPREPVRTDSFQNDQRDAAAEYQRELDRQRARDQRARDQWTRDQWTRDKEAAEKLALAQNAKWREDEVARMRAEQQRQPIQQILGPRTRPDLYPPNRFADNRFLAGQSPTPAVPLAGYNLYPQQVSSLYPVPDPNAGATASFMQTQNQRMKQLEDRVAQMNNENQLLRSEVRNVKAGNRDPFDSRFDYRDDLARTDSNADRRRPEANAPVMNRPVMAMGGNNHLGKNEDDAWEGAGAPTDETEAKRGSTWSNEMLLLWLMLLCSVGLNLYLWAISRGFYSRYQELADELRETFTATV